MHATLSALAGKYRRGRFMPGCDTPEQMLNGVFDLLLPERRPVDFLASKLGEDQLMLRPAVSLPSHQAAWPDGIVLALRGRVDRRSKLLRVNGLVSLHDHHARNFEQLVTVVPVRDSLQARNANDNLLASSWIDGLSAMGEVTNAKLQEWSDYLEWKRKLIDAGVAGARYVSRSLGADGIWTFVAVLPQSPRRASIEKALKKRDLCAFSLNYSETPWEFKWADAKRGTRCPLGEINGNPAPAAIAEALPDEAREELAAADLRQYRYTLSETDKAEFEKLCEENGVEDACKKMEERVPEQGFLATNAEGDRSLVKRQQSEIRELRENPGQAPFLAAYLFDIRRAQPPAEDDEIAEDEWLRTGMNPAQQAAVCMMVNTREISLIQGPPGSGKTTMIAEAIHQLTRRGRKVLLASQANLAVDNALERLSDVPTIRAIRLGTKADQTQPFAEPNAAASYWKTVAATCRKRHVGAWEEQEKRMQRLRQEVDDLALLRNDLGAVFAGRDKAAERMARASASLEQSRRACESARQEESILDDARRFLRCVLGADELWSGSLSSWLCAPLHARLSAAQARLDAAGLHAGHPLGMFDPMALAGQSQDIYLFARHLERLGQLLPGMRNELQRLGQNTSGQLLTAEQERRIRLLKDEKSRLIERFTSGDAAPDLQARMTACSMELAELERSGGLDRTWYERVFGTASAVFDPASSPARVAQCLAAGVEAIESARTVLEQAWKEAGRLIAEAAQRSANLPDLEQRVAHEERTLRDTHFDLQNAERHAEAALARLQRLAPDRSISADSAERICEGMLGTAREALMECAAAHQRTDTLRAEWAPILHEWLAGLQKPSSGVAGGYLNEVFRKNCNVVAVTCNESRRTLNEAGHHSFDVAIIDEVSKATPPELLMSMSMARAIVLVGDHRQLPPVFKEGVSAQEQLEEMEEQAATGDDEERQEVALTSQNMKRYEHLVSASLFKQHFEDAAPSLKSFLLTQYRMHPQIMHIVNKFYENRLECGLADPDGRLSGTRKEDTRLHALTLKGPREQVYLAPDQHVLWVDSSTTPTGEQALESKSLSGGKSNPAEAALIVQMLRDLDAACHAQGFGVDGAARKDVGVVSFYNRQVVIIKDLVKKATRGAKAFKAIKVEVNTADVFQGKEKPIILVSLVRNPPHRLSRTANTARFERINVAFSRAQELLIIVGAAQVFRDYPVHLPNLDRPGHSTRRVYGQILDEISLGGGFLHPSQIIDEEAYQQLMPEQGKPAHKPGSRPQHAPHDKRAFNQKRKQQ
ncbi:AAA domain-containing protein [Massilia sp. Root1485]|uniref:DEAD/DEAH box helicase n=1 Tax=Massilia sp. Root1485 TaxID=1736472 RepID=UPI00138F8AC8|nr:AAA domain-containing protein [Massilia sp. Root1485]